MDRRIVDELDTQLLVVASEVPCAKAKAEVRSRRFKASKELVTAGNKCDQDKGRCYVLIFVRVQINLGGLQKTDSLVGAFIKCEVSFRGFG